MELWMHIFVGPLLVPSINCSRIEKPYLFRQEESFDYMVPKSNSKGLTLMNKLGAPCAQR